MSEAPSANVTIRPAVPGADEQVIQHLRASVGWSTIETGLSSMAAGRSIVYVLEVDDEPAASGALVLRSEDPELADGETSALVSNLIVNSNHQSHGLGTRMLEHLEREARKRGFSRISIGVDLPNVRARSLYERHGYTRLKERKESWGPVIYLVKALNGSAT